MNWWKYEPTLGYYQAVTDDGSEAGGDQRRRATLSTTPSVTYPGDRCITSATHDVWQSADDGNIGNDPLTSVGKWVSPGKTNRWRAFDDAINTQTLNPTLVHYQIRPFSSVTNVSFLNVSNALTIRVQMIDPTIGTVYDTTLQMTKPPESASWWVWSFGGRRVAAFAIR